MGWDGEEVGGMDRKVRGWEGKGGGKRKKWKRGQKRAVPSKQAVAVSVEVVPLPGEISHHPWP